MQGLRVRVAPNKAGLGWGGVPPRRPSRCFVFQLPEAAPRHRKRGFWDLKTGDTRTMARGLRTTHVPTWEGAKGSLEAAGKHRTAKSRRGRACLKPL